LFSGPVAEALALLRIAKEDLEVLLHGLHAMANSAKSPALGRADR
jgi:hypothetical protein